MGSGAKGNDMLHFWQGRRDRRFYLVFLDGPFWTAMDSAGLYRAVMDDFGNLVPVGS